MVQVMMMMVMMVLLLLVLVVLAGLVLVEAIFAVTSVLVVHCLGSLYDSLLVHHHSALRVARILRRLLLLSLHHRRGVLVWRHNCRLHLLDVLGLGLLAHSP